MSQRSDVRDQRSDVSDEEELILGPCCACEATGPQVRNVIMLNKRAPVAGHGWGCLVCGLPPDGASVVLCDACFDAGRSPVFACRGYPGLDGRIDITELPPFEHDHGKHGHEWGLS